MFISGITDIICAAIRKQLLVTLRYGDDKLDRSFHPYHLYVASTDNTLVSGLQVSNPNKPAGNGIYHTFNVHLIRSIALTGQSFSPRPDLAAIPQNYKRLICSIAARGRERA
ncbi:MAG TPA: hypothetical protein PKA10_03955 [Selenomonadales bacterium]|nr:hypothetical protein [Selenomonadales bacterium]